MSDSTGLGSVDQNSYRLYLGFNHNHCLCPYCRGHKRKLADDDVASESSKGSSNEDEEGSSSEADEMAAALEAELNDFM